MIKEEHKWNLLCDKKKNILKNRDLKNRDLKNSFYIQLKITLHNEARIFFHDSPAQLHVVDILQHLFSPFLANADGVFLRVHPTKSFSLMNKQKAKPK